MWSTHSRRIVPINRSANEFCHPGGNATGFTAFEYGTTGKWLELLKQIMPTMTRTAILRDPAISAGIGQFAALQSVAPSLGVELTAVNLRDLTELEHDVASLARTPTGGLIVTQSALAVVNRGMILALAARRRLPTANAAPYSVADGGLLPH